MGGSTGGSTSSSGGAPGTGGTFSGGATGSGGTALTGGASTTGGAPGSIDAGSDGTTGGASQDGGPPDAASGGTTSTGGALGTGGAGTGGAVGTGGALGTGGTGTGGAAPFCPGVGCVNNDDCCNPGCSQLNDDDCTNICGDTQVASNEGCDDGNTLTEVCTYGAYSCQVCNATCLSVPGTTSRCGDGRVDPTNGELCDSSTCPATCADFDVCTTETLSGSGCQKICQHTAITTCVAGDGCCPGTCTAGTDADCTCTPTGPEIADNGRDDDCIGGDLTAAAGPGVYVSTTGDDGNAGTKSAPKLTVGAAATAAALAASPIFVAEGVYTEDVTARTSVFGGYEATGWTRDVTLHPTEIRAQYSGAALAVPTNALGVVVLDGLRVYGGGGAWSCSAVTVEGASVVAQISHSFVDGGSCDNGHGVYAGYGGFARVLDSIVLGGSGYYTSAAVEVIYGKARLEVFHSLLRSRPALYSYGAQSQYDSDLVLVNSIVDGPIGFDVRNSGRAALYGNDVFHSGATCLGTAGGCVATAAAIDGCTFSGCTGAAGNFSSDPLLTGTGPAERLGAGSPCIDAALDSSLYGAKVPDDIDFLARPQGSQADVGPDEYLP